MVLSINPPIRGSIVKFMITVERIKGINPPIRGSIEAVTHVSATDITAYQSPYKGFNRTR